MDEMPLVIPTVKVLSLVKLKDIVCFAYKENRWWCYTANGRVLPMNTKLNKKSICALSDHFFSINKGIVFNIDYIEAIENVSLKCIFSVDVYKEPVHLSQRDYTEFMKRIKEKK